MPTCLAALELSIPAHQVEGRSLLPLLRGETVASWRECVIGELDYGMRRARRVLGRPVDACRAVMVGTREWKYVHWQSLRPQLFYRQDDPLELHDLGAASGYDTVHATMRAQLFDWMAQRRIRVTTSNEEADLRTDAHRRHGIDIGIW